MQSYASCQYEGCKCKDTCKRYNLDSATINFKFYYDEKSNKCLYYIEKDKDEIESKS